MGDMQDLRRMLGKEQCAMTDSVESYLDAMGRGALGMSGWYLEFMERVRHLPFKEKQIALAQEIRNLEIEDIQMFLDVVGAGIAAITTALLRKKIEALEDGRASDN